MIPNPIHKVLSTFQNCKVRALLMGGQACVFYGGAEFSRDTDFAILADHDNLERLKDALREQNHPAETQLIIPQRPLRQLAASGDELAVEDALFSEERTERHADRAYWEPLKLELGQLRRNLK